MEKWNQLVHKLALSSSEYAIFHSWQKRRDAETCFQLFQVFKTHSYALEAHELLSWALVFQVRRKELLMDIAREFFDLGFIEDAWHTLNLDLFSSRNHPKGLNTLYLSALLRRDEAKSHEFYKELLRECSYDYVSGKIINVFKSMGSESARNALVQRFEDRRLKIHLKEGELEEMKWEKKVYSSRMEPLHTIAKSSEDTEHLEDVANYTIQRKLERNQSLLEYLYFLRSRLNSRIKGDSLV